MSIFFVIHAKYYNQLNSLTTYEKNIACYCSIVDKIGKLNLPFVVKEINELQTRLGKCELVS